MKNRLLIVFLSVLVLSGCQTIGSRLNNDHAKSHTIDVEVTGKNKRFSKAVNLSHRLKKDNVNLLLIGDVERLPGALVSLVKVKAKFIDKNGQIVKEEDRNAHFNSYGSRGFRKYKGTFYVEVPDDKNIVKCEVEFI